MVPGAQVNDHEGAHDLGEGVRSVPPQDRQEAEAAGESGGFRSFVEFERVLKTRGFSDESSLLIAASIRPNSSGRGYNYLVRIYMDWCSKQDPPVEPFTAPVVDVANFLAWVHSSRDLGQSAVASFRSAISRKSIKYRRKCYGLFKIF